MEILLSMGLGAAFATAATLIKDITSNKNHHPSVHNRASPSPPPHHHRPPSNLSHIPPNMPHHIAISKAHTLLATLQDDHEPPILKVEAQIAKCSAILDLEEQNSLMGGEIRKIKRTFGGYVDAVREGRLAWVRAVEAIWDALEERFGAPLREAEVEFLDKALRRAEGRANGRGETSMRGESRAGGGVWKTSTRFPSSSSSSRGCSGESDVFSTTVESGRTKMTSGPGSKNSGKDRTATDHPPAGTVLPASTRRERPAGREGRSREEEASRSRSGNFGRDRTSTDHPPAATVLPSSRAGDARKADPSGLASRMSTLRAPARADPKLDRGASSRRGETEESEGTGYRMSKYDVSSDLKKLMIEDPRGPVSSSRKDSSTKDARADAARASTKRR